VNAEDSRSSANDHFNTEGVVNHVSSKALVALGYYSHTGELFGTLGAGWGPVGESMLPSIGRRSKAKTRPQSSEHGLVATEEHDDLFRQLLG
jgi:hypothetical protein